MKTTDVKFVFIYVCVSIYQKSHFDHNVYWINILWIALFIEWWIKEIDKENFRWGQFRTSDNENSSKTSKL